MCLLYIAQKMRRAGSKQAGMMYCEVKGVLAGRWGLTQVVHEGTFFPREVRKLGAGSAGLSKPFCL